MKSELWGFDLAQNFGQFYIYFAYGMIGVILTVVRWWCRICASDEKIKRSICAYYHGSHGGKADGPVAEHNEKEENKMFMQIKYWNKEFSMSPKYFQSYGYYGRMILKEKNIIVITRVFKEILFVVLLLERNFVCVYQCEIPASLTLVLPSAQLNYVSTADQIPCGQKYVNEYSDLVPDLKWMANFTVNVSNMNDPIVKEVMGTWAGICQIQAFQGLILSNYTLGLVIFELFALCYFVFREELEKTDIISLRVLRKLTVGLQLIATIFWFVFETLSYIFIYGYPDCHCWLPGFQFFRAATGGYLLLTGFYWISVFVSQPVQDVQGFTKQLSVEKKKKSIRYQNTINPIHYNQENVCIIKYKDKLLYIYIYIYINIYIYIYIYI